jgi:hypothetical protein
MSNPEVIIVPVVFVIPAMVIFARMCFRHRERMAELRGSRDPALEGRLTRIEEAVDTIAIEIERMGEGQRFVTKLLTERAAQSLPEKSASASSGRATTPH